MHLLLPAILLGFRQTIFITDPFPCDLHLITWMTPSLSRPWICRHLSVMEKFPMGDQEDAG
jgi:hypothetical protein